MMILLRFGHVVSPRFFHDSHYIASLVSIKTNVFVIYTCLMKIKMKCNFCRENQEDLYLISFQNFDKSSHCIEHAFMKLNFQRRHSKIRKWFSHFLSILLQWWIWNKIYTKKVQFCLWVKTRWNKNKQSLKVFTIWPSKYSNNIGFILKIKLTTDGFILWISSVRCVALIF